MRFYLLQENESEQHDLGENVDPFSTSGDANNDVSVDANDVSGDANDVVSGEVVENVADQTAETAAATEEDLLTTAADTNSMEEGDEQYKNLIAESQMDNIFN